MDLFFSGSYPPPPPVSEPRICGTICIVIPDNVTWVMLGNSITDAKKFSNYWESYFHLRYPTMTFHIRSEGRGGSDIPEVTTGNRYDRRVFAQQPNIVSSEFGFNGPATPTQFKAQFKDLNDNYIIAKSGAIPIMTGPHPTYTSTGTTRLADYSNEIINLGIADSEVYSDIWHYLKPIWAANLADPTPVNMMWVDTTHPGSPGHLAVAYAYLFTMQTNGFVSSTVINISPLQVNDHQNCSISSLTINGSNGIDFNRLDTKLPMAYDDDAVNIFELMPQIYDMNLYTLKVLGLSSGTYEVYVDGVLSSTKTHTQLSTGWNMSDMTSGPIHDQLIEVLGRIRDKEGVNRTTLADIIPRVGYAKYQSAADNGYNNLGLRGQDLIDYLNSVNAISDVVARDALIKTAAQPITRAFSLRKV